jgi:glutamate carboxypeptidase
MKSSAAVTFGLIGLALLGSGLPAGMAATAHRNTKVYKAVEANRAGALELLKLIVDIDSGTGDVAGGAKVEAVLAELLTAQGAQVSAIPAEAPGLPDNLVAVFHGSGKGKI